MSRRLPIAPRIFCSEACSRSRTKVRNASTSWKEYTARGLTAISGASSGPVRGLRQWRSWLTVAPESAAAIFVAYATFSPFFAYAYHALCAITRTVSHTARRDGIVKAQARRPVRSRAMMVFMISDVPP